MDLERVAPELQASAQKVSRMSAMGPTQRAIAQVVLGLLPGAKVEGVRIEVVRKVGAGLRLYRPAVRRSDAALLWIHGGGYLLGRAVQDDRLCASTALALGIVVVSMEYRLAPKHQFPAQLDDCQAGWRWLVDTAPSLGVDPRKIAVGGISAGGGLAATLVQRVHDGAAGEAAAAQWLFCPMLDDRTAARRELDDTQHFVWNNRLNASGWRAYLNAEPGAPTLPPYASAARREDLRELPPAWIGVGDIDLFCPEDRAYAERLRSAGVAAEFVTVPGAPHGFESWAPKSDIAKLYIADAQRWLASTLGVSGVAEPAPASL